MLKYSLLSHNDNNTLAALQKTYTEVSFSVFISYFFLKKRRKEIWHSDWITVIAEVPNPVGRFLSHFYAIYCKNTRLHDIGCSVVLVVGSSVEPVAHQPPWPRDDSCW